MRRYLKIPQISAVMGPCIAGGAYLPALSDVIIMVEGTSFMGLGGANLVKGATGRTIDNETLGGARAHNELSGVAHYRVADDAACIAKIREFSPNFPSNRQALLRFSPRVMRPGPQRIFTTLFRQTINSSTTRGTYWSVCSTTDTFDKFRRTLRKEIITGHARIRGIQNHGVIANNRGMIRAPGGGIPRFGGIIYTESAEKVAYFIETCNRRHTPLVFIQDVSGFMVGPEAEHSGIIRAGARFVEAMATALVPKIVLTINHASGAGYYAMAGRDSIRISFSWPTGRMGRDGR